MVEKKFEKKTLNKKDHKGVDDAAKNVKKGGGILLGLGTLAVGIKKCGPTVLKIAKNVIKKV